MNRTNFEENYIPDTTINYQMLQTLEDFTDEEVEAFTQKTYDRIVNLGNNRDSMLKALNAELTSENPYNQALV